MRLKPRHLLTGIAVGVLAALFVTIDDWSRDFTTNYVVMSESAQDPTLRPFIVEFPADELAQATRQAALRIKNWEFVGQAKMDNTTMVVFERTSRVWKFKDDIIIRVEDLNGRSRVSGESRSRLGYGDLGQNPRNLRRILSELQTILSE